jgi:REP element-mobilizing transposase RayT
MSKIVSKYEKLEFGKFYHILNKAVGKELLFRTKQDYFYFLAKIEHYILPIADIYSYCLIPNHFHLLIKVRDEDNINKKYLKADDKLNNGILQQTFGNFFNSYSKSYNKAHNRKGSLFTRPFKRIFVENESYLLSLITYIHRNPIHHKIKKEYSDWRYSSYNAIISNRPTKVKRMEVIELFGTKEDLIILHEQNKPKRGIGKYLLV